MALTHLPLSEAIGMVVNDLNETISDLEEGVINGGDVIDRLSALSNLLDSLEVK